jgi:hypothetical protein
MRLGIMRALSLAIVVTAVISNGLLAQEMPADYAAVLKTLGKTGDFRGGVLRVNIPRDDLTVSVAGVLVPLQLGFGGWLAMTKGDQGMDVMMGDLVVTESELNPVMSAVLNAGLDVTAVHNHFFRESPRVFYMHVHGMGKAAELASKIRPAIDLVARDPFAVLAGTGTELPAGTLSTERLAKTIGHNGEQNGPVYRITIGRPDLDVREHGARIETRMGLNTWAAFAGSDDDAVVAGDVAMVAAEVTPVLKAMRTAGLQIVALHHHMTTGSPTVYFVHYWGRGAAQTLAEGVRAAVDQLGKSR